MARGRVEREADKAEGDNKAQDRHDGGPDVPKRAKVDDEPRAQPTEHEKDHQHGNQPIAEPELDTSHLTGYDEPEAPQEPPLEEGPEVSYEATNRTRDGMQIPVEPDDPSVQAEGSGETSDEKPKRAKDDDG